MLNGGQLSMPFAHKNLISQPEMEIQRAIRSQNNLYNIFNSKRNAGKISHYFINHRSTQTKNIISFIKFAFLLIIITAYLILLRIFFVDYANKMKKQIFESIFEQVDTSVQDVLQIPTMFSLYLSIFIEKGDLPKPSKDSAYLYASILTNAHLSSTGHINWWKIGLPNGCLIAIVTNTTKYNKWCYVSCDESDFGSFYEWEIETEKRNNSYPFSDGLKTGFYNTTSHYWYKMAISTNTTQWTNLYYELEPGQSTVQSVATFSAVSSVLDENDVLICAISVDLKLRYIQDFLEAIQIPSSSALAIATSDGYLIATTSSKGDPVHFDKNGQISSTIQDIDDPVWNCVSHNIQFRSESNFSINCQIDGQSHTYQLFRSDVPFSDRYNWTLFAALRVDEANQSSNIMYNYQYVTPSVICIAVIIAISCLSRLILSFIFSEQTKILLSQKLHNKYHVVDSGINQGFSLLQRVKNVRSSGRNYHNLYEITRKKIFESPQTLYFNYFDFFNKITDPEILDKFKEFYNLDNDLFKSQQINNNSSHDTMRVSGASSAEILTSQKIQINLENDDSNRTNSSSKSTKTSSYYSSSNNSCSPRESSVDVWSQESRAKYSFQHRADPLEDQLADLPALDINHVSHHQNIRNLNEASAINVIKNIGVGYNVQHQKLFEVNKFKEFLQNFITNEFPNENLFLIVDSFDLYSLLILFFGSSMFCDKDMIIAGYVALLAFHTATKNRLNNNNKQIDRFFIRNKKEIYDQADLILIQIAKLRINEINFDSKRWSNFVSYVHLLCEITPINRHIEIFQKCRFFIKPSMIFRKLLLDRSIELLSFFYLTSTVSFMINTQSFIDLAISKIFPDIKQNKKFYEQFLYCLNNIYMEKLMKTFVSICGNTFVKKLTIPT